MSLDTIEKRVREKLDRLDELDATIKFVCKEADGEKNILFLDATVSPATLSTEDDEADCTIKITAQNLQKLLDGKLDPMIAFATGKIKISGSTGMAMKLTKLL